MTPRRYTLFLLTSILLLMAAVAAFTRVVDPFWYFRDIQLKGFNLDKPRFPRNERLVKSALVARMQPEAVILGSSYAEVGLPATHPGFTDGGRLKPYNLAVSGGEWPEVYCYARFALAQPGIKRLVLGVSGTAENTCDKYRDLGEADYAKLLLSKNAMSAAWETYRRQDGKPRITAEGMWYFKRYDTKIRGDDEVMTNYMHEMRNRMCPSPRRDIAFDANRIDKSPPPADASTAGLRQLIRLAKARHVELILLYYPKHVLHYEQERECGKGEARWGQLWKIAAIAEEEAGVDSKQVQVWDFFGYRAVNAERIRSGIPMPKRLWQDAGHFNHEVGQATFDKIFLGRGDYGRRIALKDFDRAVAEGEAERQAFLADNPWVRVELDELIAKAGNRPPAEEAAP